MTKLELLNQKIKTKGYYIKKATSSRYELYISAITTKITLLGSVHTTKNLKDMELFINKKIIPLNDIDTTKKYIVSYGIIKELQ